MCSVHLQQKKKRRQVVKINKEFRISQKRPSARQSPNSRKTQATALHLNVMAAQADATSQYMKRLPEVTSPLLLQLSMSRRASR